MGLLDEMIDELIRIEPFWQICIPCRCGGTCCIGANILIETSEIEPIADRIAALEAEDAKMLARNALGKQLCVFRTQDKCLIHEVRPSNCRFTPYQYSVDENGILKYSQVSVSGNACNAVQIKIPVDPIRANELRNSKFALLPNHGAPVHYLSLNWYASHREPGSGAYYLSELLSLLSGHMSQG